ncbi:GNAT family N-acetyltransferase [Thermodesulfobacteriota bacterium]
MLFLETTAAIRTGLRNGSDKVVVLATQVVSSDNWPSFYRQGAMEDPTMPHKKNPPKQQASAADNTELQAGGVSLTGYYPGVIGEIVKLHAVYYHEYWGFDISFETQVGRELSLFMEKFNSQTDCFRSALVDGEFAGAIAIDGKLSNSEGVRLRWFIVGPGYQGLGIGAALIRRVVSFCRDAGHKKIFLWTFQGLEAARRLYEREGFVLAEENRIDQWGTQINEQKYVLLL